MSIQKAHVVVTLLSLSAVLVLGCASKASQPAEEPPGAASTEPVATEASKDAGSGTADGEAMSEEELAALAAIEQNDAAAPADGAPQGKDGGREVIYRMTPDGLKVEVEGAVFIPTAKSFKTPEGYGVEIFVEATSKAEGSLASPDVGPLAFAGRVIRKTGRVDQFGDKRSGNGTKPFGPKTPQKFSRKWPIANVSLLSPGDVLELEVGLWGYGTTAATIRPVRKFASVKMKASVDGASPVVDAPGQ